MSWAMIGSSLVHSWAMLAITFVQQCYHCLTLSFLEQHSDSWAYSALSHVECHTRVAAIWFTASFGLAAVLVHFHLWVGHGGVCVVQGHLLDKESLTQTKCADQELQIC